MSLDLPSARVRIEEGANWVAQVSAELAMLALYPVYELIRRRWMPRAFYLRVPAS